VDPQGLITAAQALARPFASTDDLHSGDVAAALMTPNGDLFTGVCITTTSSLGFCAEHAAVAEMFKARQSDV
jgi:cytidine deaminase